MYDSEADATFRAAFSHCACQWIAISTLPRSTISRTGEQSCVGACAHCSETMSRRGHVRTVDTGEAVYCTVHRRPRPRRSQRTDSVCCLLARKNANRSIVPWRDARRGAMKGDARRRGPSQPCAEDKHACLHSFSESYAYLLVCAPTLSHTSASMSDLCTHGYVSTHSKFDLTAVLAGTSMVLQPPTRPGAHAACR